MSRKSVISILIGQEITLIIISFAWIILRNLTHISNWGVLSIFELTPFKGFNISFLDLGYGIAMSVILVLLSFLITFTYEPFKKSLEMLDNLILNKIKPVDILPLALLSGIGEELFFRGLLQEGIGIYASNIIFALLHFPGKDYWVYSLWTLFAGLFFGNVYAYTHNLFIVIVAHIMNNFLALLLWQKFRNKIVKEDVQLQNKD